jgi:ABC-type transport system involved in multi-copper enzyme maturation permease subunit
MNWLLWREYRRNRWILAMGAVTLLLPSLLVFLSDERESVLRLAYFVAYCAFTPGTVGLLAAHAMAGERADRSAEFIAYLPLGRWRILASKLVLPLFAIVVISTVYLLGLPSGLAHFVDLFSLVITLLVIFGVCWLVSSFQSSTVIAFVSGAAAPVLIVVYMLVRSNVSPSFHEMTPKDIVAFSLWYAAICLPVAVVCFGIGTWNFLRQREL